MSIDVCIGNYGYYNEGELRDAWISLPKTSKEIGDFLSAHGLQDPEHEEIYISDYDGVPFGLRGLSDALEIADSTGNAFVYKGGRLMGVVLSCDKYAEVSKGK